MYETAKNILAIIGGACVLTMLVILFLALLQHLRKE